MLCVVCSSLFVFLLFDALCFLLFDVGRLLCVVCCWFFVYGVRRSLCDACCLLYGVCLLDHMSLIIC